MTETCGHVGGREDQHCPCVDHLRNICARCDEQIDGPYVQDPDNVAWLGREFAAKFCDDECRDAYAEANS